MLTGNDLQIIVNVLFSHIIVGIDRTKLSRAGEECFGDLNLPAWPCPFSYMGKILTFNRKVIGMDSIFLPKSLRWSPLITLKR